MLIGIFHVLLTLSLVSVFFAQSVPFILAQRISAGCPGSSESVYLHEMILV